MKHDKGNLIMPAHDCRQEGVLAALQKQLDQGHDNFASVRKTLTSMAEDMGTIREKMGYINGRVTAQGAVAGAIAGFVGSVIVGTILLLFRFGLL